MGKYVIHNLISSLSPDGAQLMLLRLAARIDRSVFAPVVTSLTDNLALKQSFADIDVPVYSLKLRRGVPDPRGIISAARIIRRSRTSVLQTWMYHADLIGAFAAQMAGNVPVVWNIRHTNLDPHVNSRTTLWAARICAAMSSWMPKQIVCCAEAARKSHVSIGYADNRIQVIPNGFDLERLRRHEPARHEVRGELGLPEHAYLIGLVARFHPQKDHCNFIRAAGIFSKSSPNAYFILAGDQVDSNNTVLVDWIREAGITDKVRLLGRRDDVPRILSALDVLASSSVGEGFPNVIGEAMGCEVPCVVTDVGDSAVLVGDAGIVVPARDYLAMSAAWSELAEMSPAQRASLGASARQRIHDHFSLDAVVERYQRMYSELVLGSKLHKNAVPQIRTKLKL